MIWNVVGDVNLQMEAAWFNQARKPRFISARLNLPGYGRDKKGGWGVGLCC